MGQLPRRGRPDVRAAPAGRAAAEALALVRHAVALHGPPGPGRPDRPDDATSATLAGPRRRRDRRPAAASHAGRPRAAGSPAPAGSSSAPAALADLAHRAAPRRVAPCRDIGRLPAAAVPAAAARRGQRDRRRPADARDVGRNAAAAASGTRRQPAPDPRRADRHRGGDPAHQVVRSGAVPRGAHRAARPSAHRTTPDPGRAAWVRSVRDPGRIGRAGVAGRLVVRAAARAGPFTPTLGLSGAGGGAVEWPDPGRRCHAAVPGDADPHELVGHWLVRDPAAPRVGDPDPARRDAAGALGPGPRPRRPDPRRCRIVDVRVAARVRPARGDPDLAAAARGLRRAGRRRRCCAALPPPSCRPAACSAVASA